MDSSVEALRSAMNSGDETQRVKFFCSFGGGILPRPQDGKLRYIGGETRIVSVPRDITYEELMGKMRELYEGATVLKYQQPDEDLDALVSVVNDDDVVNMMEEYEKLGSGEGFTRLRIFLFTYPDQDVALHFGDGDETDNERRYVDAVNSLDESPDFKRQLGESMVMGSFEDIHVAEQYFNQMNLEGSQHASQHGQRNMELPIAQMNLRCLTIPRLGSGQLQQAVNQKYNEMETPWSPSYYSPIQPGTVDQRTIVEFPTSPTPHFRTPYAELLDRGYDGMPEDYLRPPYHSPTAYEYQMQFPDNVVMIPTGHVVNERGGFPGNILQGSSTFPRNPVHPESSWKPGAQSHLEPSNMGNGYLRAPISCTDCYPNQEVYVMNPDANLHHSPYRCRDQNDPRSMYSETPGHERGWVSPHYPNPWGEEPRPQVTVPGRLVADSHFVENGMNMLLGHSNDICDGQRVQSPYIHHEDPRLARSGVDHGSQVFHDQAVASGSQVHPSSVEERGVRGGNPIFTYGNDNLYQVPYGHIPQTMWRNAHSPLLGGPSYEASAPSQLVSGPVPVGFTPQIVEGSLRVGIGMENQKAWVVPSQKPAVGDGSVTSNSPNVPANYAPSTSALENRDTCSVEHIQSETVMTKPTLSKDSSVKCELASAVDGSSVAAVVPGVDSVNRSTKFVRVNENNVEESKDKTNSSEAIDTCICSDIDKNLEAIAHSTNVLERAVENGHAVNVGEINVNVTGKQSDDHLEFLPELIASKKEATLKSLKEVKAKAREETDLGCGHNVDAKEDAQDDKDGMDNVDGEVDSDNDNATPAKIEMTKAEAEAIERGLQTIKNEDLEEIRELGSGTYGSVYHGKWKGSDVAIKRIKASCFAGRPSERERLIADFWREALLLSSLHHPNVVAFYGVVRDGPDGSLATVTEFMINGSLKQFLKKKDRTIDRRKRLIIAMDTAFGMEYLHGKNIVHFDLKCENLMVNMRDPHRPVCKIGDLGLSKVKQHTLVSGGVRGTLPWMAPELLSGKSNMVTEKIDVYSFGVVMWELLTGDEPYADMHCASIIGGIVNNTLRPKTPQWCDPEWKSLMESCWSSDPAQRPSFSEISQKLRNMAAAMNLK